MTNAAILRPAWTPLTIAMMVLGFIVWWPLGLAMIAYIVWGDRFGPRMEQSVREARRSFRCGRMARRNGSYSYSSSGNSAFDEYRAQELARLEEERRKLDEERREFETFMENLRKAKDKEEFDRFKAARKAAPRDIDDAEIV